MHKASFESLFNKAEILLMEWIDEKLNDEYDGTICLSRYRSFGDTTWIAFCQVERTINDKFFTYNLLNTASDPKSTKELALEQLCENLKNGSLWLESAETYALTKP